MNFSLAVSYIPIVISSNKMFNLVSTEQAEKAARDKFQFLCVAWSDGAVVGLVNNQTWC